MLQGLINNGCTLLSFVVKRGTIDLSVFFASMYMEILTQQSSRAHGGIRGFKKLYVSARNLFYANKEGYPMPFMLSILFIKS